MKRNRYTHLRYDLIVFLFSILGNFSETSVNGKEHNVSHENPEVLNRLKNLLIHLHKEMNEEEPLSYNFISCSEKILIE